MEGEEKETQQGGATTAAAATSAAVATQEEAGASAPETEDEVATGLKGKYLAVAGQGFRPEEKSIIQRDRRPSDNKHFSHPKTDADDSKTDGDKARFP